MSQARKNIKNFINLNFYLFVVALVSISNQKNFDPYVFRESLTTIWMFLFCKKRRHLSHVRKLVIILNVRKLVIILNVNNKLNLSKLPYCWNDQFLSNACLKNHANLVYFNSRRAL